MDTRCRTLLSICAVCLLCWLGGWMPAAAEPSPPPRAQTWIFAGQSNMHPRPQFEAFKRVVEEAVPGVKLTMTQSQKGGNPISNWDEGGERWPEMVDAVKDAPGEVAGLVWYQGERDARNKTGDYQQRLEGLIRRVRTLAGKPELPVVIVQLASSRRGDDWSTPIIREAQRRVAAGDEHIAVVPAMDLPLGDLSIHVDADDELGRREALAALRVAYGKQDVDHGPRFRRAFFPNDDRRNVVVQFEGVEGELKLEEGWRQGFTVARGANAGEAMADWPAMDEVRPSPRELESAGNAAVVGADAVWLRFDEPLEEGDRIGWGQTASGLTGPHRRWDARIMGVTDATGMVAPAFVLAAVGAKPGDWQGDAPRMESQLAGMSPYADTSKPFTIAVNAAGTSGHTALSPEDRAGAPGLEQTRWNTASSGAERPLFDDEGRVLDIGVNVGAWYVKRTSAPTDTPEGKMMAANSSAEPAVVFGLKPGEAYDLVVYTDLPRGKDKQGLMGYIVKDNGENREPVYVQEPDSDEGEGVNYDFAGRFIEATADNDYTGNYLVFKGVKADEDGRIELRARGQRGDQRSKIKPSISGLQVIHE